MKRRITIAVSDDVARRVRRKAAEENTSVSKLVGNMLEREMRAGEDYRRAYRRWKRIGDIPGIDAANRLTRDAAHNRR